MLFCTTQGLGVLGINEEDPSGGGLSILYPTVSL